MQLNNTAQYALRAVAYISTQDRAKLISSQELFEATDVPMAYLSKILRQLVTAKILIARKGSKGGFRLAIKPAEIRYIDVLKAIGAQIDTRECAFGWKSCNSQNPCLLHDAWKSYREKTERWAKNRRFSSSKKPPKKSSKRN